MEQLQSLLLQEYAIVPSSMEQVRSVLKVVTDQGSFAVKHSKRTAQQHLFVHQVQQYMLQSGFRGLLPYVYTKRGQPFVETAEGVLYVVPWVEGISGRELFHRREGIAAVFTQLGVMHRIGMGKYKEQLATLKSEGERLQQSWNQRIHRLNEYREMANHRVYPSPVDVAFMANIDEMMEMAIAATGRLEEWLQTAEESNELRLTLCHGHLSFDHMVQGDTMYFINFDQANIDFPARDLSYLMRYVTSRLGDQALLEQWLQYYASENTLTNDEVEILSISLQYPTALIHFLERYYSQQFAGKWTELTLVRRFEKLINEQQMILHV